MVRSGLRYLAVPVTAIAALTSCAGGSTTPTGFASGTLARSLGAPASRVKPLIRCASVTTSTGQTFTVAHVGGGKGLDIESSAYANCDIGVYISLGHGPYNLTSSVVNGSFGIGVYIDGAARNIANTSICVNGESAGACATGSGRSAGTGLYAQNVPNLLVKQTLIDGYLAGLATGPCPYPNNYMSISGSTVTHSVYPWSFQGGFVKTKNDSPTPVGGSCAGSAIGDGSPNVFVADEFNNAAKEITTASNYTQVNTLFSGFTLPVGIAVDVSGNVFIAEYFNNDVKEISAADGYTTAIPIGSGFSSPFAVAVDASDNVFVADSGNNAVKEVLAAGGYTTVNTLSSSFNFPEGIAVDASDNVFVSDTNNGDVKEMLAAGGYTTINTIASGFRQARHIAVDARDNVFVAEYGTNSVKEILAAGGYITINKLGKGFSRPTGVTVDANGNVYVADFQNNAVKEIVAAGNYKTIKTLGSGFNGPFGVAVYNPLIQGMQYVRVNRSTRRASSSVSAASQLRS